MMKEPKEMFEDGWCKDCECNYSECVKNKRCLGYKDEYDVNEVKNETYI